MNKKLRRLLLVEQLEQRALLSSFYVSPKGKDNNDGSSLHPWLTLQHAADNVQAGDVVTARPGTYDGFILGWNAPTAGTASAPIIFRADPTAPPLSVIINHHNSKTHVGIDIEPGCDYITISGFAINGAGDIANYPKKGSGIKATGNHDVIINNTVTKIDYGFGITSDGANDIVIENNTVTHIGSHGDGAQGHGIYVAGSTDGAVIRGNIIHDNDYIGFHINGDPSSSGGNGLVTNALIEDNVIYNNGQNGINADGIESSTIRNNLIYNYQDFGIVLFQTDASGPSKNNVIVSNTIASPQAGAGAAIRILDAGTGNTLLNNILLGGGDTTYRISHDSLPGLVSNYNVVSSLVQSEDTGATGTFGQWVATTGQDVHSFTSTPAALFLKGSAKNFHLSLTSPAIDAGTSLDAPATDLDGNPRPSGKGYDIGCYQYQFLPSTPPTNFSATGQIGFISLTWTAGSNDTSYNVYRSTTSGFSISPSTLIGSSPGTTFSDIQVTPTFTYYYLVTGVNDAFESSPSSQASGVASVDTQPPAVTITTPSPNATVSSIVTVSATATDDGIVAGIQFALDGNNLGAAVTAAPYSVSFNTAQYANGTHQLSATATDSGGLQSTATINITIANTPGLVAAYSFDEGSGSIVHDLSGNGNNGTIQNATWNKGGKYGGALSFNGTNSWVTINDSPSLDLTNGMTLEAWVGAASLSGWRVIMDKERIAASGLSYTLYATDPFVSPPAPASFINTGGADQSAAGTAGLKLFTWTFLASTYDGTTLKMYVNGLLVGSTPVSGNILETTDPLHIGGDAVWGEWFQGRIDNVRIYNQALSQSQIQTDMNTPVGSVTPAAAIRSSAQGSSGFVSPGGRSGLLAEVPSQDVAVLGSNQSQMVLLSYANGSTAPGRIDNGRGTIAEDGLPSVDRSATIQAIVRLFSRLEGTDSLANRLNGQGSRTAPRSAESASLEQLFTLNGRQGQETTGELAFWLD